MAAVTFRAPDVAPLVRQLTAVKGLAGTPTPLVKAWGVEVLAFVGEAFRRGGQPAWKPLAASTVSGRRQGKGSGSAQLLRNTGAYQRSFDLRTETTRAVVFSTSPIAPFQEFGTKGPYEIRPKHGKALALPFLPGRDAGKGTAGTGKAGRFSLSGMGRGGTSRATGKKVAPYTNVSFRMKVIHPGLAKRPVFPTPAQITPRLIAVGQRVIAAVLKRRGA